MMLSLFPVFNVRYRTGSHNTLKCGLGSGDRMGPVPIGNCRKSVKRLLQLDIKHPSPLLIKYPLYTEIFENLKYEYNMDGVLGEW